MKPYVFLLRKLNHEGKLVIHSSWIGHRELPPEVVQHNLTFTQMISKLKEFNYKMTAY